MAFIGAGVHRRTSCGAFGTTVGQLLENLYASVQGSNVPLRVVLIDERVFAFGCAMLKLNLVESTVGSVIMPFGWFCDITHPL